MLRRDPVEKRQRKLEAEERERSRREEAEAAELTHQERERAVLAPQRKLEFELSPAGTARVAFQRSDDLLQVALSVRTSTTYTVPMVDTGALTQTNDPNEVLNAIAREGWDLVAASFVFHETGSESRDKLLASGQHIAVSGDVIGYYVFKRCEANRVALPAPWERG
jgi:hypothetical protein